MVLVYAEAASKSACLAEKACDSGKIMEKGQGTRLQEWSFLPKGENYFFLDLRRASFRESRAF